MTFRDISGLQKRDRLRVGERKGIFQIKVALSVEIETLVLRLGSTYEGNELGVKYVYYPDTISQTTNLRQ